MSNIPDEAERQELEEIIYDAWRAEEPRDSAQLAAAEILAAGYRKVAPGV